MYRLYVDLLSARYRGYTDSSRKLRREAPIPMISPYEIAIRACGSYLVYIGHKLEDFKTQKSLYSPLRQHHA